MVVSKEIVIGISPGIHFRPAEKITNSALEFDSKVSIIRDDYNANAKSFLNLIGAGFRYGEKVTLICEGPDENEALERIRKLLTGGKP